MLGRVKRSAKVIGDSTCGYAWFDIYAMLNLCGVSILGYSVAVVQ